MRADAKLSYRQKEEEKSFMRIRIFQPKSASFIESRNPEGYNLVYGGKVECKSIDDIVSICNSEFSQPPGFCGESLS